VGCSTGMSATLLPRKSWTICRALISFQADTRAPYPAKPPRTDRAE
jgi:hypothetical protein